MIKPIITIITVFTVVGCTGSEADNSMITNDLTSDKYKTPGNAAVGTFGFNNKASVDWPAAYQNCVKSAGVKKEIDLEIENYGRASTIALPESANISKSKTASIDECMQKFSIAN